MRERSFTYEEAQEAIASLDKPEVHALTYIFKNGLATKDQIKDIFNIKDHVFTKILHKDDSYYSVELPNDYDRSNCEEYINQIKNKPSFDCELCGLGFHNHSNKVNHVGHSHDLSFREQFFVNAIFDSIDDCWEWRDNYDKFIYSEETYPIYKVTGAVRQNSAISKTDVYEVGGIRQVCGNKDCINPSHIRVSQIAGQGHSKYKESQMRFVKWLGLKSERTNKFTKKDVSEFVGVPYSQVSHVCNERIWKNLTVPDDYEPPPVRGLEDFLENNPKVTCQICGEKFDSTRGLSVHRSKSHYETVKDWVQQIRYLHKEYNATTKKLTAIFPLAQRTILKIINEELWDDVEIPETLTIEEKEPGKAFFTDSNN